MSRPEPPSGGPTSSRSGDVVADLRAAVEQVLVPAEQQLDGWDVELPQALAGPGVTPALRQGLAELRASVQRCREAGETMTAAAHRAIKPPTAEDQTPQPPARGGDPT
jgi:hypothetical protein